jgi:hypothetical protein
VTGVVDVVLPTPEDAASIELLVDGQVVDSYPVGGEPAPVGELVRAEGRRPDQVRRPAAR